MEVLVIIHISSHVTCHIPYEHKGGFTSRSFETGFVEPIHHKIANVCVDVHPVDQGHLFNYLYVHTFTSTQWILRYRCITGLRQYSPSDLPHKHKRSCLCRHSLSRLEDSTPRSSAQLPKGTLCIKKCFLWHGEEK